MHQIVIDIDKLIWMAAAIGTVATAVVWLYKGALPMFRPLKEIRAEVKELKSRKITCDQKFEHDAQILDELRSDVKELIKAQLLIMKHVETGNCTGEVAAGREHLQDYLIDKD